MTRNDAKQKLIEIGIESPTEDQVTKYLNSVDAETKSEKSKAEKYKTDADKAKELQKQLDEIEQSKLSDMEKLQKQIEKLAADNADWQKKDAIRTQRQSYMDKLKLTSEQASKIVKDDGTVDVEFLGQVVSEKEIASANAKEQEIAKGASNPNGGNANNGKADDKTDSEKVAEAIGKQLASSNADAKAVVDTYL